MFEDSLVESGGRLKGKREDYHGTFVHAPNPADWRFSVVAFDLHRGVAPAATDDIPGCAAATASPTAATGGCSGHGKEDPERIG